MTEHSILWKVRTRWAAVGAAVAVVLGAGGIAVSGATNSQVVASQTTITPCRIMDTRSPGTVGPRSTPLGLNTTYTIQVTGKNGNCTLPTDVDSVVLNLTVANIRADGYITVFPAGAARPTAASINYGINQKPVSNSVTAALSSSGQLSFYAFNGPVDLIADVVAYTSAPRLSASDLAQNRWDKDRAKRTKVTVGTSPSGTAFDGSSVWVANELSGTVSRIDAATATVTATITVGTNPAGVLFDGTSIWVSNNGASSVSRINPATNTVTATVTGIPAPQGLAFDGTNLWVASTGSGGVKKVSPASNSVVATVSTGTWPWGAAFDGTSIWVSNVNSNTLTKINPTTNAVVDTATLDAGSGPTNMVFDGHRLWAVCYYGGEVAAVDTASATVERTISTGVNPMGIAYDGTNVWVTDPGASTIWKVDPLAGTATSSTTGAGGWTAVFDGTSLWTTDNGSNSVNRIPVS